METSKVYIDKKIGLDKWLIPDFLIKEELSSIEGMPKKAFAIILSFENALKLSKEVYETQRIIVDCCETECLLKDLREICLKTPFFIVLKEKERDIEKVFEIKKIPLKKGETNGFFGIVYSSQKMEGIISLVKKVAKTDATVLIRGESGTGKELVAKAIHGLSKRKNKSFVAVNCASIPDTLLEAELFGHKKGAFTDAYTDRKGKFEQADGGTIFLDEIGDMPLSLQAKILRVLQEKEVTPLGSNKSVKVDVRVLSATSRNLEEMVKKGEFREDLYYRLNVIPITLPPLRERKEDIALLSEHFLQKTSQRHNIPKPELSKNAIKTLEQMEWKGNIRELENFIEKLMVFNIGKEVISEKEIKEAKKDF